MGAGILPTTIYKNKLYFLFGKENQYEDSAKGFSDFGGGADNSEGYLETACREASEELTGYLGGVADIRAMLHKAGTYPIDLTSEGHATYRMHIFPFAYNEYLPLYYNNNQRFLQRNLDAAVIKKSKIFEKAEIAWFSVDEMMRRKREFRSYFQTIVDMMWTQREAIREFIRGRGAAASGGPVAVIGRRSVRRVGGGGGGVGSRSGVSRHRVRVYNTATRKRHGRHRSRRRYRVG